MAFGAAPAQAFTTGTIAPPDFLTLSNLQGGNVVTVPFTSDAAQGSTLYLTVRDTGPGNSTHSKTVTATTGNDGSGAFRLIFGAPSDVAVGDVLYFAAFDSPDPHAFAFASATQMIVAPGALSSSKTDFFAGSWANGLQLSGSGFPRSAQVTVSVVTGDAGTASHDFIPPLTATTDSAGAFVLAVTASALNAGGPPQLPGTSNTYYRVTAVDSLGNRSVPIGLNIRSIAAGTKVTPSSALAGETVTVTAAGLQANESLEIWLHSTPVRLLSGMATSPGAFTGDILIPGSAAVGTHQLEVRGAVSGSQWLGFAVSSPPPPPSASPSPSPSAVVPPSPEPVEPSPTPVETAPSVTETAPPPPEPELGALARPPSPSTVLPLEPSPKPGRLPLPGPTAEPAPDPPAEPASSPSSEPAPTMEAAVEPAGPRPGGPAGLSGDRLTGSSVSGGAAATPAPQPLNGEIAQSYSVDVVAITAIGSGLLLLGPVLVFGSRIKRRQPTEDPSDGPSPL